MVKLCIWWFFPGANEFFLFDMETFRYAIDVVEVCYYLCRIVNGTIVETMSA